MESNRIKTDLIWIFSLSSFIFIWKIWSGSLMSWDEAVYAQVAREMFNSGNLIDLTWAGGLWADKPPLYFWFTAFFYKLFGVSEFSARLFSSLCGIGTVLVTYLFANKLFSRKAAVASALILISTWHFIWSAKAAMLDTTLTFFIILSLFLFRLGEEKKIYLFFSMLAFAFAFLTKAAVAFVIPVIIIIYLILSGKLKLIKEPAFLWGVFAALFVLGIWHILAFKHYGNDFLRGYIFKNFFVRSTQAIEGHTGTFFTYFKVLPNKGRPWAGPCFAALIAAFIMLLRGKEKSLLIPVIWYVTVFLLFSFVKTKLHWYIIPIYPAMALIFGWGISKITGRFTIAVVSVLTCIGLLYLIYDKKIFNLDYCPQTKALSLEVKKILPGDERVYLYGIGDPGVRFYLGDRGENIPEEKYKVFIKEKDKYIFYNRSGFPSQILAQLQVVLDSSDYILIKTK
jgi:4-amino-4-deoxy-L-arabinose transferase-like glycosyltransferase